ncbi:hypothetical protein HZH68_014340 [Vespula germanica]|uniref:Uncharacterized protein n=1 Tax=Vespula germanica TaxID=30212 RepID=A0A834JAN8_VESGE|nr:hypothetical protein HZH68_014340 [Vespula germanica]
MARPSSVGGMVWSGLVWSGLVWSLLFWSSLAWSGLVWSGLVDDRIWKRATVCKFREMTADGAMVLRDKGCKNILTIFELFRRRRMKCNGKRKRLRVLRVEVVPYLQLLILIKSH